ncbi:hypothetical protein CVIRNUC_004808 [Coccomyxa viridis]|uniref:Uncharacterized protein n=1 Tax=Coccomyxa viridis TaxID=1274662 RepID=A0AAV1I733_9CHLO|nr:hypothetical protein CVIRNUC_004808 [Coccomyxa viridis]
MPVPTAQPGLFTLKQGLGREDGLLLLADVNTAVHNLEWPHGAQWCCWTWACPCEFGMRTLTSSLQVGVQLARSSLEMTAPEPDATQSKASSPGTTEVVKPAPLALFVVPSLEQCMAVEVAYDSTGRGKAGQMDP